MLGREAVAVFVWALFLAGLTLAQLAFTRETYSYGLLGGAALATALLGAFLLVRRRPAGKGERFVPEISYPTVAFAIGIAAAALGVPFGPWLVFPGLGLLVLGAAGLVLERRAQRRRTRP